MTNSNSIDLDLPFIAIALVGQEVKIEAHNYQGVGEQCTGLQATQEIETLYSGIKREYKDGDGDNWQPKVSNENTLNI